MAKKIYLNGGANVIEGESREVDSQAIQEADKKIVCILDLTTNDETKKSQYREPLENYFKKIYAKEVFFHSTSKDITRDIKDSDILYLPGGDTELFLENLEKHKLVNLIKRFNGRIIGNSAGAMILCKRAFCVNYNGEKSSVNGLGMVNMNIDVHYNKNHDKELTELSKDMDIYAIPEKSVIIIEDNQKKFVGEVYKFSKRKKIKLN